MTLLVVLNVALGLTFLVSLAYLYMVKKLNYWTKKNVVTSEPTVFFGNIRDVSFRKTTFGRVLLDLYRKYPNEKVVGIYRYWNPSILVRDPDIIKHIMIKDFDLFVDRGIELNRRGVGINLFHLDGEYWRSLRNKLTPIFTSGKLKHMMYLMNKEAKNFLSVAGKMIENKSDHDVYIMTQIFTTGNIATCAFGIEVDSNTVCDSDSVYRKLDKHIFKLNRMSDLDMMIPGVLRKFKLDLFPAFVTSFFQSLVAQIKTDRNNAPSGRKDFMDLLLELRQNNAKLQSNQKHSDKFIDINDEMLAAQAFIFYAAGYETSATTISFLLYELAKNFEIQDKIVKEINEVLTVHNNEVTFECISDLKYLGQAIDETLRMYPILDPLQRILNVDKYILPGTDVVIEKGTIVFFAVEGLHYDEKYFPNPFKFDPDRFSQDNSKTYHSCVYLPFGTGPRNCIGMRFAQTAMRVFILNFLKNYKVSPAKDTPTTIQYDPTRPINSSLGGIKLKIETRI